MGGSWFSEVVGVTPPATSSYSAYPQRLRSLLRLLNSSFSTLHYSAFRDENLRCKSASFLAISEQRKPTFQQTHKNANGLELAYYILVNFATHQHLVFRMIDTCMERARLLFHLSRSPSKGHRPHREFRPTYQGPKKACRCPSTLLFDLRQAEIVRDRNRPNLLNLT